MRSKLKRIAVKYGTSINLKAQLKGGMKMYEFAYKVTEQSNDGTIKPHTIATFIIRYDAELFCRNMAELLPHNTYTVSK